MDLEFKENQKLSNVSGKYLYIDTLTHLNWKQHA